MTGSLADAILARVQAGLSRAQSQPIAAPGQVAAVDHDGNMTVQVGARTVQATPATEEPILAGESVWTSRTTRGTTIIHGASR